MTTALTDKALNKTEARRIVGEIQKQAKNLRNLLLELRDRTGWKALGYETWAACCETEFGYSKNYANKLITAEKVKERVGTMVPTEPNERQARELARAPEDQQAKVWEAVNKETDGKPTAAAVKAEVDRILPPADDPYEEPKEEDEPEPDPPVEEVMAYSNQVLGGLARKITGLHKEAVALAEPHLDEDRLAALKSQLRAAAGTVLAAKGHAVCTYCDGAGCKTCLDSGWLTKIAAESAPPRK